MRSIFRILTLLSVLFGEHVSYHFVYIVQILHNSFFVGLITIVFTGAGPRLTGVSGRGLKAAGIAVYGTTF
jgi:hypothetical protein